jgi:hypothetical protein
MSLRKVYWQEANWILLVQYGIQCQALLHAAMDTDF